MALLCVRSVIEDESSVCFRTDFFFFLFSLFPVGLHLTVTNDFCRILYINSPTVVVCETTSLLSEAALSRCGSSPCPPLHVCDLLQLGRRGPHAFCIALGYCWVCEGQSFIGPLSQWHHICLHVTGFLVSLPCSFVNGVSIWKRSMQKTNSIVEIFFGSFLKRTLSGVNK